MIDWGNLIFNAAWIVAASIALAALSYAAWEASDQKSRLRDQLARPGYQLILNLAGLLFCIGLAGTSTALWETLLWGFLAAVFLWQVAGAWQTLRRQRSGEQTKDRP